MVVRGGKRVRAGTLFTTPINPRTALYYGLRPDSAAVAAATGLEVGRSAALASEMDSLCATGLPVYLLRDFEDADFAVQDSLTRGGQFVRALVARHSGGGLVVHDGHP